MLIIIQNVSYELTPHGSIFMQKKIGGNKIDRQKRTTAMEGETSAKTG